MKTCPYCAEEIQDAAIKCRYCQSWLVDEIPAGADRPPVAEPPTSVAASEPKPAEPAAGVAAPSVVFPASVPAAEPTPAPASAAPTSEKVEFTHSGERFLLGYTDDSFGIWDRQTPAAPSERFPRTDDGWRQVWERYAAIETNWMDLRTGQRSP